MLRKLICGLFALAVCAGALLAEDIQGTLKKYENRKITITVDDKDKTFDVAKDVKVYRVNRKTLNITDVKGGLPKVKTGTIVTITTEKKDDKDMVTQVQVGGVRPKKKAN
jgi:hypothetical protein